MMSAVQKPSSGHAADRLALLAAALLFSTGGAAVKLTTLSGWQVASLRSGIAAVTLLLLLPAARRGWSWRPALVGLAYAGTMVTYVLANKLTTAANAIFLQSTAPLYILLLGPLLLSEPIRRRQVVFMAAIAAGLALFFVGAQPVWATAPKPLQGNLVGILTGFFWALTIIGLRWLGRVGDDETAAPTAAAAVVCGNVTACLVTLPMALPMVGTRSTDWAVVAFLGVFQIALAYVFMVRGVGGVGALEASLLLLLEPVLSPLWAWLVHGEQPTGWALLGGAIIITATAIFAAFGDRTDSPSRNGL
jgi:drug/metabolite transporter (DMT)-like permease